MGEPLSMLVPCSDHGCILRVDPSRGMGTNGGCKCADQPTATLARRFVLALARDRRQALRAHHKLDDECAALRARVAEMETGHTALCTALGLETQPTAEELARRMREMVDRDTSRAIAIVSARHAGAEAMRERAAALCERARDERGSVWADESYAAAIRELPLTDATESEER